MDEKNEIRIHNIILENRTKLSVSGVTDVESFDDRRVLLYTCMGELTIRGRELRVGEISVGSGDMLVEGDISALVYGNRSQKKTPRLVDRMLK